MNLPTAKKQLGQHWLTDKTTLEYICDFAEVNNKDTVLEVGPGVGTLTEVLSQKAGSVVAVEFDPSLASRLAAHFSGSNVSIVNQDIMSFDLMQLSASYKVVANIPYYLTSNLLRKLLEANNKPESIVLLVQKEVAERITAGPGKMSVLSVSAQFYAEVELGQVVPAHLFSPAPKVDSQVVKLILRPTRLFIDVSADQFFTVVKAGFAQRRKKLRSSLSSGLRLKKSEAADLLLRAGISPDARAQELTLEDWRNLAKLEAFNK